MLSNIMKFYRGKGEQRREQEKQDESVDEVTSTHTDPPSRASRTMTAMMMMMVMAIMMMEGSSAWGFPGQCLAGYVHCLRYTSPSFQLKRLLVGSTLKAVSVCIKMIFSASLIPYLKPLSIVRSVISEYLGHFLSVSLDET